MSEKIPIILASNSPRRKELLALGGKQFETRPADVDETPQPGETPPTYVKRLAIEKAQQVAADVAEDSIIVAADTTVVHGGRILGKPVDTAEAREMLLSMRAGKHDVYSGLALLRTSDEAILTDLAFSKVPMREYSDEEIEAYIESGDPFDKAGAYGIQNEGFHPVAGLAACYANVMGLPLCHLSRNLAKWDLAFSTEISEACQAHLGYDCPVFDEVLTWLL